MNLTSCDSCGVVLDKDQIYFPDVYGDDGCVIANALYIDGDYVSAAPCPVCRELIPEKE